ncbi:MAG: ADP-ribosylation factor-like protein [Promethearchaeota archaeon]
MEEPIKIIIMGMENAGKTTLINILTQENDETPDKPPFMNPTKGIERNSITLFQKKTMIWDFGGQETYRNEYLTNAEKYFHWISFFYYVIDVQDYYRLIPSVMYFDGILRKIQKFSPQARVILLFHKMDPGFDPNERNLKKKFLEKVEPLLQQEFTSYLMFDTTIFNLGSIRAAFSQIK